MSQDKATIAEAVKSISSPLKTSVVNATSPLKTSVVGNNTSIDDPGVNTIVELKTNSSSEKNSVKS
jgi:hypothetical protein